MENTNPVYQYAEQDINTYLSNADYLYGHALVDHQQQVKMLEEQKELKPWFAARLSTPELSSSLSEPSTQFSLDFDDSSLGSSLGSSLNSSWQGSDSVLDYSGFVDSGSLLHGFSPNPTENVPASYQASGNYAPQDIQMQIKSLDQGFFDLMEAPIFIKPEPRNKTWNLLEDTAGARSPTPDLSFTSTASSWSSRSLVSSSLPSQACSVQPSPQDPSRLALTLEYTAKTQPKSNPSAGRRYVRNGDTHKETRRHKQTPSVFCTTKMQVREGKFYFCEHQTCQYAVKGFQRRDNLLRHIRSVHGEKHGRIKQPNPHRTKAKSSNSRETVRQRQRLLTAADLEAIDGKCRSIQAFRTRPAKGVQPEHLHGQQSSQSAPRAENFDEKMHTSKSPALAPVVTTSLQSDSSFETEDSCDDTDFSDSSFPDSPNSAQRTNIVRPVLSPLKLDLVNRVMVEFYRLFDTNFGIRRHEDGAGESGSQDTPIEERSQKTSDGTSGPGGQKRKNRDDGSSPPDGGNDDDPNKRRKGDPGTPASKWPGGRKLACPFFKYNPSGHSTNRACVYPGFPSISRVKEHLYRNHALPIQCPRCCQTFSNDEDCLQHQRAQRGCEWKEGALLEGVSKAQEAKLRSKKRSTSSLPDEARWKVIYGILFPQVADDQIPSAYCDFTSLQECTPSTSPNSPEFVRFEDFSRKKLPELVRTSLEVLVEQNTQMQLLEETLKSQLIDIVRDSQEKLFSMYQDARSTDSSPPTTAAVSSECLQRTIDRQSTANPSQTELAEVFMPPPLVHGLSNGPDLKEIQQEHQAKPESSKDQSDSGYGSANTSFGSSESSGAPQSSDAPAEIEPPTIDTLKTAAKPNENSEPQIAKAHSRSPSITQSDQSSASLGFDQPNGWQMLPEFDTSLLDPMIPDYFPNSDYNWAWNVDGENNSFTTYET